MPLTVKQLTTPVSKEEALQLMLDELESLGFNVTNWHSGSVQRTFLKGVAVVWALATQYVDLTTRIGFNESSYEDGLTLFSRSHYDNERVEEIATEGVMLFTGAAVGPPHTVSVGDVVVQDEATGLYFENTEGGTIPASGTKQLAMRAREEGTASNIPNGSTLKMSTTFTGVTVTNPDPGTGTWITTLGVDAEDDDTLRTRNRTKWATLNWAAPEEAYINLALNADTDVTRVAVDDSNPRGPGTVDVYIARADGVAVSADVTTVQEAIDAVRPVSADAYTQAAAAQPVTISGTVYVTAALHDSDKEAEIEQAAIDYINSLVIGGDVLAGSTGVVPFSELLHAITDVEGVRSVALTSPTADVTVSGFAVATVSGTPSFSYVDV